MLLSKKASKKLVFITESHFDLVHFIYSLRIFSYPCMNYNLDRFQLHDISQVDYYRKLFYQSVADFFNPNGTNKNVYYSIMKTANSL